MMATLHCTISHRACAHCLSRRTRGERDMEELFQSIGLSETKARETAKNISVSNLLKYYILQVYPRSYICSFLVSVYIYIGTGVTEWICGQKERQPSVPLGHSVCLNLSISSLCRSCLYRAPGPRWWYCNLCVIVQVQGVAGVEWAAGGVCV